VSACHTRQGRPATVFSSSVSPSLAYLKWHAYDGGEKDLDTEKSRLGFLEEVANAVERVRAASYEGWYRSYEEALQILGLPPADTWCAGRTLWRLLAGYATNPALEGGITLHRFLGFPFLPGSSVRGLVHHVAEADLLENEERKSWAGTAEPPAARDVLGRFLDDAEQVKAIFGSLMVKLRADEPAVDDEAEEILPSGAGVAPVEPPPETPRSLLARWQASPAVRRDKDLAARIRDLLESHTGGLVAFYDAVPDPRETDLLQLDILNPHYPDYYDSAGAKAPPSDDQSPRPIYFLAVRPGARFRFPFRLACWPREPPQDEAERERLLLLHGLSRDEAAAHLRRWLTVGLTTWGAGAKTAAGYGYFEIEGRKGHPEHSPSASGPPGLATPSPEPPPPAPRFAPHRGAQVGAILRPNTVPTRPPAGATRPPAWDKAIQGITKENAEEEVQKILAAVDEADHKLVALKIVQRLGPKFIALHRGKPWADDLLRYAD
jgi:CRISPR type III-B/RAMP module RAMP protein Cmr6